MEKKIHFDTDYMAGAHPAVMEALLATNLEETPGYGEDQYTLEAKELILEACGSTSDETDVNFLIGGTQTNAVALGSMLRSHQGVLAADTAHINVHEAGAIELGGHKVLTLPSHSGKVDADEAEAWIDGFYADETWPHMVQPAVLYITHPTELGAVYSLAELERLSKLCHDKGLYLYLDGARLAYGLGATDVSLKDLARLCDAFYIGGTKCGALLGEALVMRKGIAPGFFSIMKQHGAVLAKGRVLGVQFKRLFTEGLYEEIGRHGLAMARMLKEGMAALCYEPIGDSPTNQQFFRIPNALLDKLRRYASFEVWGAPGRETTDVRFVTSWATRQKDVERFLKLAPKA